MGVEMAVQITCLPAPGPVMRPAAHEMTLGVLRAAWGEIYDLGFAGGEYHALHLTSGRLISAATPEGLESAIRADWSRR